MGKDKMFGTSLRSSLCGKVDKGNIGNTVKLCGWVNKRRDHGNLIFVDLRDFTGLVQLVFDPNYNKKAHSIAKGIRNEHVLCVEGDVRKRTEDTINPDLKTGEVEVFVKDIDISSKALTPPFGIDDNKIDEMTRLKYRYLDLRTPRMQKNLRTSAKVIENTRRYFYDNGFVEVETPILAKSTPEGARDFLVPSRINPTKFYALPQSPQLFKQILMFSGFDRIFQIARCFRDEDLRADRQLEFTQIDLEMSFVKREDIITIIEGLMQRLFKDILSIDIDIPFKRLDYTESIDRYGTDKPDLRYDMGIKDISGIFEGSEIKIFKSVLEKNQRIKCIVVEDSSGFARKDLDDLVDTAKKYGAGGLVWIKVEDEKRLNSPIAKFFKDEEKKQLIDGLSLKKDNLVLIIADEDKKNSEILGQIRVDMAKKLGLAENKGYEFVWVVDFPLFEWDTDEGRLNSMHHPFTMPTEDTLEKLDDKPLEVMSKAYDIVLNGQEIGGGSIRINDIDIQRKIFGLLGLTEKRIEENFGFFLKALEYGAPPHGGIALGMDRLSMNLGGLENIREVIAFPKTQSGVCMMTDSPSSVSEKQLQEVFVKIIKKKQDKD